MAGTRATKKLRKGDTVQVMQGKETGKRGKVLRVLAQDDRVVVERVNFIKRHVRPSQKIPQGGVIEREGSLHISTVEVVCPSCDQPTRVGVRMDDDSRVRYCKKCNASVDRS